MTKKASQAVLDEVNPRIYVACLASYNAGKLKGVWIDCSLGLEHIQEEIQKLLKKTRGEEYAIHDSENFPGYRIDEHESLEMIAAVAEGIEKHGEAFAVYAANDPSYWAKNPGDLETNFEDHYRGSYDNFREFSDELADEMIACHVANQNPRGFGKPDNSAREWVQQYFDYDAFARDLEHDYLVIEGPECKMSRGQIHVFDR